MLPTRPLLLLSVPRVDIHCAEHTTLLANIDPGDHLAYMRLALSLAAKSPPKPTNFRVGAVLVDPAKNHVLATGFTLEVPGNTHAEQCCLAKYAADCGVTEEAVADALPAGCILYSTVEPCE